MFVYTRPFACRCEKTQTSCIPCCQPLSGRTLTFSTTYSYNFTFALGLITTLFICIIEKHFTVHLACIGMFLCACSHNIRWKRKKVDNELCEQLKMKIGSDRKNGNTKDVRLGMENVPIQSMKDFDILNVASSWLPIPGKMNWRQSFGRLTLDSYKFPCKLQRMSKRIDNTTTTMSYLIMLPNGNDENKLSVAMCAW